MKRLIVMMCLVSAPSFALPAINLRHLASAPRPSPALDDPNGTVNLCKLLGICKRAVIR
jgi:hypothetical protein